MILDQYVMALVLNGKNINGPPDVFGGHHSRWGLGPRSCCTRHLGKPGELFGTLWGLGGLENFEALRF